VWPSVSERVGIQKGLFYASIDFQCLARAVNNSSRPYITKNLAGERTLWRTSQKFYPVLNKQRNVKDGRMETERRKDLSLSEL
jgi:hypothetical protein